MGFICCRGPSYQKATKYVAIIHICFSFILLWMIIQAIQRYGSFNYNITLSNLETNLPLNATAHDVFSNSSYAIGNQRVGVGISLGLVLTVAGCVGTLFSLGMDILLLRGVSQRCEWKCHAWFIFRTNCTVTAIIAFIFGYVDTTAREFVFFTGPTFLLHVYFLWIVYSFLSELRKEEKSKSDHYSNVV